MFNSIYRGKWYLITTLDDYSRKILYGDKGYICSARRKNCERIQKDFNVGIQTLKIEDLNITNF